jgi:hypothetical protein
VTSDLHARAARSTVGSPHVYARVYIQHLTRNTCSGYTSSVLVRQGRGRMECDGDRASWPEPRGLVHVLQPPIFPQDRPHDCRSDGALSCALENCDSNYMLSILFLVAVE